MKKITLQFDNSYYGKHDTIKKEIDCEFQAGNASLSPELQLYSIQNALCLSLFDFVENIGLDAEIFKDSLEEAYKTFSGEETLAEPEPDTFEVATDTTNLDFDEFVKQFNESDDSKSIVFETFQDSFNED